MKSIPKLTPIGLVVPVHEDARRIISGCNANEVDFSIQRFVIKKEGPLGNHYHKEKDEVFVIVKGSGRVILQHVDFNNLDNYTDAKIFFLKEGSVVYVSPYTAHTFMLRSGSEMICFSTRVFNPKDEHPWVLVMPERVKES